MLRFTYPYRVPVFCLLFLWLTFSLVAQSGVREERTESAAIAPADGMEGPIDAAGTLPNFTPFRQDGWDDIIVISTVSGTLTDDEVFTTQDDIFVDCGMAVFGAASPVDSAFDLLFDGNRIRRFAIPQGGGPNVAFFANDVEIGPLPPGRHTLEVVVDPDDVVQESDETDNRYLKEFVVGGPNFQYIPQFGAGNGLSSTITVTGISPNEIAGGEIFFFDPDGNLIDSNTLLDGGGVFSLPPLGSQTFVIPADTNPLVQGPAIVASDSPVSVVVRFALPGFGLAGVPGAPSITAGVVPIRQRSGRDTGIAVQNTTGQPIDVQISLLDEMGNPASVGAGVGSPVNAERTLPVGARLSELLTSLFNLPNEFFEDQIDGRGSVRITSGDGTFAAVALELAGNNGGFTVLPVVPFPIHNERGEAGQLRETAQAVGPGISEIAGVLGIGIDLFQVSFDKTVAVTFTTDADFDANLFLFDEAGRPLAANDDVIGLDSQFRMKLAPGVYFVAIGSNNSQALDDQGQRILDNDDGVLIADGVLADWEFPDAERGAYRILIDSATAQP